MLDSAISFAAVAHAGQVRKYTGEPYIVHPVEVMALVCRAGGKIEMQIAAVLHDVLEDTVVSAREIERRFGSLVLSYVQGLTDPVVEGNRAVRKAAAREHLWAQCYNCQVIKCADLISNTASIVEHDPKFAKVYFEEKQLLLEGMAVKDHPLWQRAMSTLEAIN